MMQAEAKWLVLGFITEIGVSFVQPMGGAHEDFSLATYSVEVAAGGKALWWICKSSKWDGTR